MKVKKISGYDLNEFAKNHEYYSYYQTENYADLMKAFNQEVLYIGFFDNDLLIGASLIVARNAFMGFKYGYAPRGLLIDYNNYAQSIEIITALKAFLFKEGFMLFKMDPLIIKNIYNNKKVIYDNKYIQNIFDTLTKQGFVHCGYNNYFEAIKPRYQAFLNIDKTSNEVFKALPKNVRNKMNKSIKYGLSIIESNDIDLLYKFIEGKGNYPLSYYRYMQKFFKDNFKIYLVQLDSSKCINYVQNLYDKELEDNDYYNNVIQSIGYKGMSVKDAIDKKIKSDSMVDLYKNKIVEVTNLLKDNPDNNIIIGGAIVICDNNINIVMEGYDNRFNSYCPSYAVKNYLINKYCNFGYKYLNLNAIGGDFMDKSSNYFGLNQYKLNFNPDVFEYIGEFNLVINNPIFTIYRNMNPKDSIKLFANKK